MNTAPERLERLERFVQESGDESLWAPQLIVPSVPSVPELPTDDTARDAWALTVLLLADPTAARVLLDALRRWPASRTTRHLIRSISDSQREDDL